MRSVGLALNTEILCHRFLIGLPLFILFILSFYLFLSILPILLFLYFRFFYSCLFFLYLLYLLSFSYSFLSLPLLLFSSLPLLFSYIPLLFFSSPTLLKQHSIPIYSSFFAWSKCSLNKSAFSLLPNLMAKVWASGSPSEISAVTL